MQQNPKNQNEKIQQITETNQQLFYFDSHTHMLDYQRQSPLNLDKMLQQAAMFNVKYIAANTCCTNQFKQMENITSIYSNQAQKNINEKQQTKKAKITIIPSYGIHPCYICEQIKVKPLEKEENQIKYQQKNKNQEQNWKNLLRQYLMKNQSSHVGQIGLDFRKDVIQGGNPKQNQWKFFQYQFQLAIELKRSVTIHCVRASGQLLKYFKKICQKYPPDQLKDFNIILHSYGGNQQITKSLLKLQKLNLFFSLSLKHSKSIIKLIPIQKIILETDAPYQNDYDILMNNKLWEKEEIQRENKEYQQKMDEYKSDMIGKQNGDYMKSDFKGLLKECKFFNKFVLDNRPMNVIANYKEVSKHFQINQMDFVRKITKNALRAFKLLK